MLRPGGPRNPTPRGGRRAASVSISGTLAADPACLRAGINHGAAGPGISPRTPHTEHKKIRSTRPSLAGRPATARPWRRGRGWSSRMARGRMWPCRGSASVAASPGPRAERAAPGVSGVRRVDRAGTTAWAGGDVGMAPLGTRPCGTRPSEGNHAAELPRARGRQYLCGQPPEPAAVEPRPADPREDGRSCLLRSALADVVTTNRIRDPGGGEIAPAHYAGPGQARGEALKGPTRPARAVTLVPAAREHYQGPAGTGAPSGFPPRTSRQLSRTGQGTPSERRGQDRVGRRAP